MQLIKYSIHWFDFTNISKGTKYDNIIMMYFLSFFCRRYAARDL